MNITPFGVCLKQFLNQTTIDLLLRKQKISEDEMKLKGASFPKKFNLTFKVVIWKKVAFKSQSLKKKSIRAYYTQCNDLAVRGISPK